MMKGSISSLSSPRETLSGILSDSISELKNVKPDDEIPSNATPSQEGFCTDCEDQPAHVFCEQCMDDFCQVCFEDKHKKGNRRNHTVKGISIPPEVKETAHESANLPDIPKDEFVVLEGKLEGNVLIQDDRSRISFGEWMTERVKYIPVRLSLEERKLLRLLEAALNVSEYTDRVDIIAYTNKSKRIVAQIKEFCQILCGLVVASDYKVGQELFAERNFEDNAKFFQRIFEIGRRYKIMNPERMRENYGKLIYLLQDSMIPEVQSMVQFKCVTEIKTVYKVLCEGDGIKMLEDERIIIATKEIVTDGKTRNQIRQEVIQKEKAVDYLSQKFRSRLLSEEDIKLCLYSIADNHCFLRTTRDACDKMITYLTSYFYPERIETGYSLSICNGVGGARLSHDHERQYHYVLQSLTLWSQISNEMFMLWMHAEQDLLDESNPYRLRDTGQGLNRVQGCPRTSKLMHKILSRAQKKMGYWVGSSVIHLGDSNVPNAFMFIDKYTQLPRILNPILTSLQNINAILNDRKIKEYIYSAYTDVNTLKKTICCDFFKHAFDGSGADNYFSAGSCIDGRLTSAWNWCSQIEKKHYFPVFLLTGFVGFDGKF